MYRVLILLLMLVGLLLIVPVYWFVVFLWLGLVRAGAGQSWLARWCDRTEVELKRRIWL